jgi:hypothetical protein
MRSLLTVLIALVVAAPTAAQTIHLAPLPQVHFPEKATLLLITPAPDSVTHALTGAAPRIRLTGGRMYISQSGGVPEIIELGDRPIAELMSQLQAKYRRIGVSSDYPEVSTAYLAEGTFPTPTAARDSIVIGGREVSPRVTGILGLGFTLNEVREGPSANRLFRNGGFHLDLVGDKQFREADFRVRIGFRSAEAITVGQQNIPEETLGDQPPASVISFVETAERITVGAHVDVPVGSQRADVAFRMGLEIAASWNALPSFQFRPIPVNGELVPVSEVFDSATIQNVRARLDQVIPLNTVLVGPKMIFGPRESSLFYAQIDAGFSQDPVRSFGVRYRVDPGTDGGTPTRVPINLLAVRRSPYELIWRIGVGTKLAGIIDLRVDGIGQIAQMDHEVKPLLRVLIGSDLGIAR